MFISYCIECYIYVNQESPINVQSWIKILWINKKKKKKKKKPRLVMWWWVSCSSQPRLVMWWWVSCSSQPRLVMWWWVSCSSQPRLVMWWWVSCSSQPRLVMWWWVSFSSQPRLVMLTKCTYKLIYLIDYNIYDPKTARDWRSTTLHVSPFPYTIQNMLVVWRLCGGDPVLLLAHQHFGTLYSLC